MPSMRSCAAVVKRCATSFSSPDALGSLLRGVLELTMLSRLFRRGKSASLTQRTFQKHQVYEPLDKMHDIVDRMAPSLEGQDMQDIDNLIRYAEKEMDRLPQSMKDKLIGTVAAPTTYDRSPLQTVDEPLRVLEQEVRQQQAQELDRTRRNTVLYLAVWEVVMLILLGGLLSTFGALNQNGPTGWILLVVLLAMILLGFAFIPLRGPHHSHTLR